VFALTIGLLPVASSAAELKASLAEAAMREDKAALRTLLQQKADVNGPAGRWNYRAPLGRKAGDLETVELLLQAGANAKRKIAMV